MRVRKKTHPRWWKAALKIKSDAGRVARDFFVPSTAVVLIKVHDSFQTLSHFKVFFCLLDMFAVFCLETNSNDSFLNIWIFFVRCIVFDGVWFSCDFIPKQVLDCRQPHGNRFVMKTRSRQDVSQAFSVRLNIQ